MDYPAVIGWTADEAVWILDQTLLPDREEHRELDSVDAVAEAIRRLRVRGAPLIGVAAAMGMTLALRDCATRAEALVALEAADQQLRSARPTAVNLGWALDRIRRCLDRELGDVPSLRQVVRSQADQIREDEQANCEKIGVAGLPLLPEGAGVMTICNAGALATGGLGTATAPIYLAHSEGRRLEAIVPETRPLLQGARLTAWELMRAGISATLIPDGAIASRLAQGDVTCAIVGADRIAANGDVANKIGTLGLALAAWDAKVPLYVAAPRSTFDPHCPTGAEIPIELRDADEVRGFQNTTTAPSEVAVWNPAFDVTPARLITGYIMPEGLLERVE